MNEHGAGGPLEPFGYGVYELVVKIPGAVRELSSGTMSSGELDAQGRSRLGPFEQLHAPAVGRRDFVH